MLNEYLTFEIMVLRTLYLQWLLLLYLQNYKMDSINKKCNILILSIKWLSLSLYFKNFNKNSNKGKIALLVSTKKLISCSLNSHT